jgi:hypothetical protein
MLCVERDETPSPDQVVHWTPLMCGNSTTQEATAEGTLFSQYYLLYPHHLQQRTLSSPLKWNQVFQIPFYSILSVAG